MLKKTATFAPQDSAKAIATTNIFYFFVALAAYAAVYFTFLISSVSSVFFVPFRFQPFAINYRSGATTCRTVLKLRDDNKCHNIENTNEIFF